MTGTAFVVTPTPSALRALNYSPAAERLRRKTNGRSLALGDMLKSMGPAYGAVFTRNDCAPEFGIELVSQSDMFAAEPSGRVIRRDSMARPERHEVRKWQILIAGAGTLGETELYGRSIIADARLAGKYVGPHAMVLTFHDEGGDDNCFAYALLCSDVGVQAVRSTSFGTKILGVRKDLLAGLPIPQPDSKAKKRVAKLIRTCVEQRERYVAELQAARKAVENLSEMQEAHEMCAARRAHAVCWDGPHATMCAWNHASAGEALRFLRNESRTTVADFAAQIFPKVRFTRIPCAAPYGMEMLSQRDIFMIRRIPRRVRPPSPEISLFANEDTLLIARDGQVSEGTLFGSCELAQAGLTSSLISEHVMQLRCSAGAVFVLYAFLSTLVGKRLLQTTAVGTSIPTIREDLLLALPVPNIDSTAARTAESCARKAIEARLSADAAELQAIRIIEEEVLPEWLD